mmetsp:Transcript_42240/g.99158  ORF Transcript_42240/g.99158 Transcript_42240/m.99158 type:complete len:190 (-) Transcript_42240:59-628(-)
MAGTAPRVPRLLVFDLDACLWMPEMFELDGRPTHYDSALGGVRCPDGDVVRLFPGALSVLRSVWSDKERYAGVSIAVASSTTRPDFAFVCLEALVIDSDSGTRLGDVVKYREIFPGSKAGQHFPNLAKKSGIAYSEMCFWDDCTYGDNCGDVAGQCRGTLCVRTPEGLTVDLFERGLAAFARGASGVLH